MTIHSKKEENYELIITIFIAFISAISIYVSIYLNSDIVETIKSIIYSIVIIFITIKFGNKINISAKTIILTTILLIYSKWINTLNSINIKIIQDYNNSFQELDSKPDTLWYYEMYFLVLILFLLIIITCYSHFKKK